MPKITPTQLAALRRFTVEPMPKPEDVRRVTMQVLHRLGLVTVVKGRPGILWSISEKGLIELKSHELEEGLRRILEEGEGRSKG